VSILIGQHSDFTWYLLLACKRHPHFWSVSSVVLVNVAPDNGIFPDFPSFFWSHLVLKDFIRITRAPGVLGHGGEESAERAEMERLLSLGQKHLQQAYRHNKALGCPDKKWPKNGKMMSNSLDFGVADFRNPIWVGI